MQKQERQALQPVLDRRGPMVTTALLLLFLLLLLLKRRPQIPRPEPTALRLLKPMQRCLL